MRKKEGIKITGKLTLRNHDTGEIVYEKKNTIVDDGLNLLADIIGNGAVNPLGYLALGDGLAAVLTTDTALGNELFRKAFTSSSSPLNVFSATTTVLPSEALFVWKEAGIFNAAVAGTMFSRLTINYDHPAAGVTIDATYEVTFTRA